MELVEDYRERQAALGKKVLVTASTGLAASNLSEGRIIHSALKWNSKAEIYDYDKCVELLKATDILIIDEVSRIALDHTRVFRIKRRNYLRKMKKHLSVLLQL